MKKRSLRDLRQELRSIYSIDGQPTDMTRLTRKQRPWFTRLMIKLLIFFAVLSALAWTGFFLFADGLFHDDGTLAVSIEGSDTARSGEEVEYTVRYENTGEVPLANTEMKLNLPLNFHLLSSLPEPTDENNWTIGTLSAGSDGAVTVRGVFLSEVPSSERFQVLITYKPANFNSEFQTIKAKTIEVKESVLSLTFSGPEKALSGDDISYTINVQHTGTKPVYNIRLVPLFPQNFSLLSSEPALAEGETAFTIDAMEPGELRAITLVGQYTSLASGTESFTVRLGFVDEETFLKQAEATQTTEIIAGALSFHLIVNGSDKDQTAELGSTLRGSIDLKNTSEETLRNLAFTLTLASDEKTIPIDWKAAMLADGMREGSRVEWSSQTTKALEALAPEASTVIDFSLPIFSSLPKDAADAWTLSLEATLQEVGGGQGVYSIRANPIQIQLNSNLAFSAEARYFNEDGQPVGSGPLPPTVGETTIYRVYIHLSNSLHDLQNVRVSASLPEEANWLNRKDTDIGEMEFNQTTRTISWTIAKLPTEVPRADAWFDIALIPTSKDIGTFIDLTNQITLITIDGKTSDELNQSDEALTSELPTDAFAKGKGAVVE